MRAVCEVLGITDVVAKSHGSSNPYNLVRATLDALKNSTTRLKSLPSAASRSKRSWADGRDHDDCQQHHQGPTGPQPDRLQGRPSPPCAAWACANSIASANCRIPRSARHDQQDQLPGQSDLIGVKTWNSTLSSPLPAPSTPSVAWPWHWPGLEQDRWPWPKGQKSRSGGYHKVGFEGGQMPLQRRLPKRGFKSQSLKFNAELTLADLQSAGRRRSRPAVLKAAGLVPELAKKVKVINTGELDSGCQADWRRRDCWRQGCHRSRWRLAGLIRL